MSPPTKRKTPKKVDMNDRSRCCGIKNPVSIPAIATDHHGSNIPKA